MPEISATVIMGVGLVASIASALLACFNMIVKVTLRDLPDEWLQGIHLALNKKRDNFPTFIRNKLPKWLPLWLIKLTVSFEIRAREL